MRAHLRQSIVVGVLLFHSPGLDAQAWTPRSGQGTISLALQTLHADAHLTSEGIVVRDVDIRASSLTLAADYGFTDRLAVSIQLPYVRTRFAGGDPHSGSVVDDGTVHGTPTDARVDVRYRAIDSRMVISPALGVTVPSTDYETFGHAAPGRGLIEYSAGFDLGYQVVPISPALFVGAGYHYSYVERIDEHVTVDRSNAVIQSDYLLTSRLAIGGSVKWQRTHGGLDLPLDPALRPEHGHHHDQLARANFTNAALGVSYALTSSLEVFGGWSTALVGVNTHVFRAWTAGLAWRFERSRPSPTADLPTFLP